eukprot:5024865-Lingulodinium_polyedra.AAC.1
MPRDRFHADKSDHPSVLSLTATRSAQRSARGQTSIATVSPRARGGVLESNGPPRQSPGKAFPKP